MRLVGTFLGLATLFVLEGLASACQAPPSPGTTAGSFAISGTLLENTCAPGLDPHQMLSFVAELRRDGGAGYWRQEGGTIVSGTMGEGGHFHFVSQVTIPAYGPDRESGTAGCSLTQSETIDGVLVARDVDSGSGNGDAALDAASSDGGRLDGGAGDAGTRSSLSGENTIVISTVAGSNCTRLLIANGGDFPAFPCQARYALTGVAR